ncbi:hypothetical protein ACIOUE_01240 [Streptomyces xanthochromogenes]|uniref:hypothetical protein n=1 Tax=Streptomyces xanthochromogenes TaxID=67384 RepID=UPI00380CFD11
MIDVQNGFVNEHSRHVVPVIGRLIEQWEAAGAPVLFSRYFNHPGSGEPHPAGRLRANRPLPPSPHHYTPTARPSRAAGPPAMTTSRSRARHRDDCPRAASGGEGCDSGFDGRVQQGEVPTLGLPGRQVRHPRDRPWA